VTVRGPKDRCPTLQLLGGFGLISGGRPVDLQPRVQRLVAYLAILPGAHTREAVSEVLWPIRREECSRNSLRQALFLERQAGHGLIQAHRHYLRLAEEVAVDLNMAQATVQAVQSGTVVPDDLDQSMLTSDLLPDWDEEWLELERERFRQSRLHALELICERMLERRQFGRAIETALTLVSADGLRESAWALLIRAHLGEHNRHAALCHFQTYRVLVERELGAPPSHDLETLLESAEASSRNATVTTE
jgi:DNA-binding SARP family transcriptional activator